MGQPEAAVPANYNLITLVGNTSGRQSFFGQGAGRYRTSYNVVQDCVDFLSGKGFYSPHGQKVSVENTEKLRYYVRGGQWPKDKIQENWGEAIVSQPVSVESLHAWLKENPQAFVAAISE